MIKKTTYVSIGIITMILGIMLAIQFRTNRFIEQGMPADRVQELMSELSRYEKDNRNLDREIGDLSYKLEQARKGQTQAMAAINDELNKAMMGAGVVRVSGPGLEVVLDNPPSQSRKNGVFILRDEDLLRTVNELRGAGAEAISINGHRLISISEIRQAGNFIDINLDRAEPPFQILAIGNQDKLKSSLEISGGLVDYFRDLGLVIKVQPRTELTIPGYNKDLRYAYAKAVRKG